jgi:hypothetical protein
VAERENDRGGRNESRRMLQSKINFHVNVKKESSGKESLCDLANFDGRKSMKPSAQRNAHQ